MPTLIELVGSGLEQEAGERVRFVEETEMLAIKELLASIWLLVSSAERSSINQWLADERSGGESGGP